MGETREQMVADLREHGYAEHTRYSYVRNAERFVEHFMMHPCTLDARDIQEYMLALEDRGLSAATRVVHLASIKFLYRVTLGMPEVVENVPHPRVGISLPQILSYSEIMRVFEHITSLRCRVAAMTIYAAGLRVSEVCGLACQDIDSERMLIRVRMGKGNRDRFTMLSKNLLRALRAYWYLQRPSGGFLFPSETNPNNSMSPRTLRSALRRAGEAAGVEKPIGPHILRHCFATHLLDLGADIRQIQLLLGHGSVQSTARYTQMSTRRIAATKSPFDASLEEVNTLG